jgi:isopenicillin-N N-acyltransferase like protein
MSIEIYGAIMNSNDQISYLFVKGDAKGIGLEHGRVYADRIARVVDLYREYFALPEKEILFRAGYFKEIISRFSKHYIDEIEAIAEGADIDPLWIYALNARSELLSVQGTHECTTLHANGSPFIGQNWDWEKGLEAEIILKHVEYPDGHRVLTLTEPGILGKIGLNNAGVGVCFNFLSANKPAKGLPTHLLLRALLDSRSWSSALATLERAGSGRTANIMIANSEGDCIDVEFDGLSSHKVAPGQRLTVHTNHYVGCEIETPSWLEENTYSRYQRIQDVAAGDITIDIEGLKRMLSDQADTVNPILQHYQSHEFLGEIGTVCTVVMDTLKGEMFIRKGNNSTNTFRRYSVHD